MRSSSQIRQTNFAQNERNFSASSETVCSLERKFSSVAASISLAVGEKIRSVRANFFAASGPMLGGPACEKLRSTERKFSPVGADISLAGGEKVRSVRANLSVPSAKNSLGLSEISRMLEPMFRSRAAKKFARFERICRSQDAKFFCSNRANFSHVGGDISLAGGEKFRSNRAKFSHVGANISLARAKNVGHFELIISLGMRNHSLARSNDAARCGVDRIICSVAISLCTLTHAFNTCNAPAGTVAQ